MRRSKPSQPIIICIAAIPMLLILSGCESLPADPRSYPLQWQIIRELPHEADFVEPVQNPASEGDVLVLTYFDTSWGARFIEVEDVMGSHVLQHRSFQTDGGEHEDEDEVVYTRLGSNNWWLDPLPLDSLEVYLQVAGKDSKFLLRYRFKTGGLDTIATISKPDHVKTSTGWDQSYSISNMPLDSTRGRISGYRLNVGYFPVPREIVLLRETDASHEQYRFRSGAPLEYCGRADLDGDNIPETLWGCGAPCNGNSFNGITDTNAGYVALKDDGQLLWHSNTIPGGGGSHIYSYFCDGELRLTGLRYLRNFVEDKPGLLLHSIDPSTGALLTQREFEGAFGVDHSTTNPQEPWGIHYEPDTGVLTWLSLSLDTLTSRSGPRGCSGVIPAAAQVAGKSYAQMSSPNGTCFWLDPGLRVVGRTNLQRYMNTSKPIRYSDNQGIQSAYLMKHPDRHLVLAKPVLVPWWRWWTWRHRWLLLFGVGAPAVVAAIYFLTRFLLLRRRSRQQLRMLVHRLQHLQEEERSRVSRELHDDQGQMLTLLKMELRQLYHNNPELQTEITDVFRHVESMQVSMRRLVADLRPSVLDDLGLEGAIEWLLEGLEKRTDLHTRLDYLLTHVSLPSQMTTALFRVIQEATNNVIKHANAENISVRVCETDNQLRIMVDDDGVGIPPVAARRKGSLGLLSMQERLGPWHGRLSVSRLDGAGTRVLVEVPLVQDEA